MKRPLVPRHLGDGRFIVDLPMGDEEMRRRGDAPMTDLITHARAMSEALLKVRPLGGSELFRKVGDEYFADPDYCGAAIDKLRSDLHAARLEIAQLRKAQP